MRYVPGPDLPGGGKIIGLDGVREAYQTGKGSFRIRATARVEQVHPRRKGIVITELPYLVGPERVIEQIKNLVNTRKVTGIADVRDLSDRTNGLRLVIEIKNGFNPDALLEQLYRLTKLEDSFAINAVALVDGQPRTLTLRDLLTIYLEHRYDVTRRRTAYARRKAEERLHLVEGLLVALLDIDDVIAIIRNSDDVAAARARLIEVFELSEVQANYILDMPLRRLTRFSQIELESERDALRPGSPIWTGSWRTPSSCLGGQPPAGRVASSTVRRGGPSCSVQRRGHHGELAPWRSPTPLLGAALLGRSARPDRHATRSRRGSAGQPRRHCVAGRRDRPGRLRTRPPRPADWSRSTSWTCPRCRRRPTRPTCRAAPTSASCHAGRRRAVLC